MLEKTFMQSSLVLFCIVLYFLLASNSGTLSLGLALEEMKLTGAELKFDWDGCQCPDDDIVARGFPVTGSNSPKSDPIGVVWVESLDYDAGLLLSTLANQQAIDFNQVFRDGCLGRALPVEGDTPVLDFLEGNE